MLIGAAFFLAMLLLTACAGPDAFGGSRRAVEQWGQLRGFASLALAPSTPSLLVLGRGESMDMVSVYIEGDGAPWLTLFHPPRDPTPGQPVALALAAKDPASAVVYLGRPCQYLESAALRDCPSRFWTSHRFAPEVVAVYQTVLDQIKTNFGVQRFRLYGYSGGGVIAALLALRRNDIDKLVTIAAPVAVTEWTQWHGVSPLAGSLDPATEPLQRLPPAVHFAGGEDEVAPVEIISAFAARSGGRLRIAADFDHQCCWSRDWPYLLVETR